MKKLIKGNVMGKERKKKGKYSEGMRAKIKREK